ncbi:hypothetical protein HKD37_09G025293 [Glycine soja]
MVMRDDTSHVPSPILEGEPPRQSDEVHEDHAQGDVDFYPPVPVKGPTPVILPQPNLLAQPIFLEMITMMVDTLPVFYYKKLVGYMPSSFANLVFAGERIEVGLKRGKFDYVSSTSTNARRIGATGAKRKKEIPMLSLQRPHGSSHRKPLTEPISTRNITQASRLAPRTLPIPHPAPASIQREAPQAPAPTPTRPAGNAHFGAGSNAIRKFSPRPTPESTPIPMTYEDLLSSLIANQMAVISPGKIYQPSFPKWYNPNTTCAYHGKTPGHSTEKCLAFKYKVQHLIDVEWLTFQEDRTNVKMNPLANHVGGVVNAVESGRPRRSKPLKDVTTPRRFIYEALQKGGIIPHGGHEEDSCLMHPGELHNMETCLAVEDLLQQMIDRGQLEVGDEGSEEQHIFKPIPFPYQNSHAVPWRYAPPSERKEEATDISSLSAKVTNITGLSGVTRSGQVFAPPDLSTQLANAKGKAKIAEEQNDKVIPTLDEDIPMKGYKPTQADIRKSVAGRKSGSHGSQLGRKVEGGPPCHISRSFISAGLGHEGQVIAICEDDSPSGSDLVQPCPPDF